MKLRNCILVGLALAVLTVVFTFGTLLLSFPRFLVLMGVVSLWYAYVAIRWTQPRTTEAALALRRGMKWGVAIGSTCAAMILAAVIPTDFVILPMVAALLLPFVAGASSAIKAGMVRTGVHAGVLSGLVGGLIWFWVLAAAGYLRAWLSGEGVFAFLESHEFGTLPIATQTLFLYGSIFCPIAATVGSWIGIQLEKTGRIPPVAVPPVRS